MTGSATEDEHRGPTARPEVARGRRPSTTRQDVARAALELFARQGYDDTTIDEIAAAVGISRRTFFRYYESKPDVVWGEFDAELVRLRDRLAAAPGRPADDGRAPPGGHGHQPLRCRRARRAPDPDRPDQHGPDPGGPLGGPLRGVVRRGGRLRGRPASGDRPTTSAPRRWPGPPSGRPWPPSSTGPDVTAAIWSARWTRPSGCWPPGSMRSSCRGEHRGPHRLPSCLVAAHATGRLAAPAARLRSGPAALGERRHVQRTHSPTFFPEDV